MGFEIFSVFNLPEEEICNDSGENSSDDNEKEKCY